MPDFLELEQAHLVHKVAHRDCWSKHLQGEEFGRLKIVSEKERVYKLKVIEILELFLRRLCLKMDVRRPEFK